MTKAIETNIEQLNKGKTKENDFPYTFLKQLCL